jgi:AbrB family looped-hinge helix DNA binding protein
VTVAVFMVSERGQMALPAEARRRWNLSEGGSVEVVDLGGALLVLPADRGGLQGALRRAVESTGGYAALARRVGEEDPDLA